MKQTFFLVHPQARLRAVEAVTSAPEGVCVEIKEKTRSLEQNDLLHRLLREIAKSVEWAGSKHDVEVWKRLLTAAWLRARGEQIVVLPALDGAGVDVVFRRTSELSVKELTELVEYIQAWAIDNNVEV